MHTYPHTVAVKRNIASAAMTDTFRALLILTVFVATGAGISGLDTDPGAATQPSAQAGDADWHGNVARSGK